MISIAAGASVFSHDDIRTDAIIKVKTAATGTININNPNLIAYPPLINNHDHLVGNWYPRAGKNRPYINSHIWVEDMRTDPAVIERNRVWTNSGLKFELLNERAQILVQMAVYKNLCSGVGVVSDHIPRQPHAYYRGLPITVLEEYSQVHSLTLGNWWGGGTPAEEMARTNGKIPFIIHIGEGLDEVTAGEFDRLCFEGLLQANTLLIHGIAFNHAQLARVKQSDASICWCPASNVFLIGQTLRADLAWREGVNMVLGTDSSLSGSVNLLDEYRFAHQTCPQLPLVELYKMVTVNAVKALCLKNYTGCLTTETDSVLLMPAHQTDPFANLLHCGAADIDLFVYRGYPLCGWSRYLDGLDIDRKGYYFYKTPEGERFIYGHPEHYTDIVDKLLDGHKLLPYLPYLK